MDAEVVLQEEDMEGSWTLLSWLASFFMVFGGALPYIPQYQEIQRCSNTEGFSTRVCFVLLIANILRIFFWIGKQFEMTLLLQSVVMILTMFAMLHLCCTVHNTNRVSTRQHRLSAADAVNRRGTETIQPADSCVSMNTCILELSVLLEVECVRGLPALLLRLHRAVCSGDAAAAGLGCVRGDSGLAGSHVRGHARTPAAAAELRQPLHQRHECEDGAAVDGR
uniref:Uncharacterized protein n=1 Tax=Amphiprion ocellaris TaxID=80972 RepID=A0AAQ5X932_AMPOC